MTAALAGMLVRMFNDHVDWVRYDGNHISPTTREQASHRLVCTRWNTDRELPSHTRKRIRAMKTRPKGYALAVCAVPVKARREDGTLKLVLPLPHLPLYSTRGSLAGKRKVLSWMVTNAPTPHKLRKLIRTLPNAKCDSMYRNLLRAHRRAVTKFKKLQRRLKRKLK